jgi:hypothetical protein
MKVITCVVNNPIFIELCPTTRQSCFMTNFTNCHFTTFFIVCECNEKEEIILNNERLNRLYELLDLIV